MPRQGHVIRGATPCFGRSSDPGDNHSAPWPLGDDGQPNHSAVLAVFPWVKRRTPWLAHERAQFLEGVRSPGGDKPLLSCGVSRSTRKTKQNTHTPTTTDREPSRFPRTSRLLRCSSLRSLHTPRVKWAASSMQHLIHRPSQMRWEHIRKGVRQTETRTVQSHSDSKTGNFVLIRARGARPVTSPTRHGQAQLQAFQEPRVSGATLARLATGTV